MGGYNLFIIAIAILLMLLLWLVLRYTRIGLIARGAMQNADVASSLGYNPQQVYMWTFTAGAALSGLAGGVMAPLTGLLPSSGSLYIAKAFITVITGGAAIIAGTLVELDHLRHRQPDRLVRLDAGDRRDRDARAGDHPAAPDAAGHHRALLQELDMTGGPPSASAASAGAGSSSAALVLLLLPAVTGTNTPTLLLIWALFALSLGLMWGFAGILSFGHAAYFGLGAYTYAIAAMNVGESTGPLLLAIAAAGGGRRGDRRDDVLRPHQRRLHGRDHAGRHADPVQVHERDRGRRLPHRLGAARRLQRHPGLPDPQRARRPRHAIYGTPFYYVVAALLLLCYLLCRWILGSFFGRVLIGIRENEARVELLGYSAPAYKTAIFTISAAMAGLAGCLFANWAEIVTPGVFSLGQSAEVIIWTIVGGLGTLVGPILGAIVLGSLKLLLGQQTLIDNSLVLGAILVLVVLLLPSGMLPTLTRWRERRGARSVSRRQATARGAGAPRGPTARARSRPQARRRSRRGAARRDERDGGRHARPVDALRRRARRSTTSTSRCRSASCAA